MARLTALLMAAALVRAAPASADPVDRWARQIGEASERFDIPEEWIRRVMRAESGGRTRIDGRPVVSSAGAMGLMQLMPATWRAMRERFALGPDPHDPHDNILAGTAYLRLMYDRFGYPGLFAAYNAGPARYADYLSDRRPLPPETLAYVATISADGSAAASPVRPRPVLFVAIGKGGTRPEPERNGAARIAGELFVELNGASGR